MTVLLINILPEPSSMLNKHWLHERCTLTENRKYNLKQYSVCLFMYDYRWKV